MKNSILKAFLLVVSFSSPSLQAQTTPIIGDLTISGAFKAGTASSTASAEFTRDGMFLLKGNLGEGNLSTFGTWDWAPKLLWHGGKGAFRAGRHYLNQQDIGNFSAAFGDQTYASGSGSFATGVFSFASGYSSTAGGDQNSASGYASQAFGSHTYASGTTSSTFGYNNFAYGECSIAAGSYSTASGAESAAFGVLTRANSYASFAVGLGNLGEGDPTTWVETDPIFEVGNGKPPVPPEYIDLYSPAPAIRSNAMTVYKNGNVDLNGNVAVQGIITCAPGGDIPMFTGN